MRKYLLTCVLVLLASAGCSDDRPEVGKAPDLVQAEKFREQLLADAAPAEAPPPSDLKPEDHQTVSGTVVLSGQAPAETPLKVDKDLGVCLPGGGTVTDHALAVDPQTKGLKNVLIYIENVPAEWVHESAQKSGEAVFDQKACLFLSPILAVQTSQKLLILNSDPIGHNTKFEPRFNDARNITLAGGDTVPYQPTANEDIPFEVTCTVHSWMKAYMIFRDNGYFAVTDDQGKFEIPNVPTGVSLQVKIWHPLAASMKSITVGGEKVALSRGAMQRTFTPGQPTQLELSIEGSALK